jgi:hypothetical protein
MQVDAAFPVNQVAEEFELFVGHLHRFRQNLGFFLKNDRPDKKKTNQTNTLRFIALIITRIHVFLIQCFSKSKKHSDKNSASYMPKKRPKEIRPNV